ERPVDGEVRIVPANVGVGRRIVGGGAQVGEQRPLAEGDEPVGEALRDPEVALVLRAQQYRGPAPEMRRAAADVDGYVPDLAFEHRDVLALRVGPLVMQPAQ